MKRGVAGRPVHLAFAVLAAPLLVALAAVVRHRWYPTGDFAYIELMMRAIPAHAPLVGVAGRFGSIFAQGSHAGPAMLYELFPVYFLLAATPVPCSSPPSSTTSWRSAARCTCCAGPAADLSL